MDRDRGDADQLRRQRSAERLERVTLRRTTLQADAQELPSISGEAAVSLAVELTRAAWSLSGKPFPRYGRAETPYVFVPRSSIDS